MMRQNTRPSSVSVNPHMSVANVKPATPVTITLRVPKRATSQPVIGVTMAVARMLNVIAQAISSGVAENEPCICGRIVETISSVVP